MSICTFSKYQKQCHSPEPYTTISTFVHTQKHKTRSVYLHVYTCIYTKKKDQTRVQSLT